MSPRKPPPTNSSHYALTEWALKRPSLGWITAAALVPVVFALLILWLAAAGDADDLRGNLAAAVAETDSMNEYLSSALSESEGWERRALAWEQRALKVEADLAQEREWKHGYAAENARLKETDRAFRATTASVGYLERAGRVWTGDLIKLDGRDERGRVLVEDVNLWSDENISRVVTSRAHGTPVRILAFGSTRDGSRRTVKVKCDDGAIGWVSETLVAR